MKRSTLFLALISTPALVFAATETKLNTQIVTSNGLQQSEFKAPFSSEIHDATDIERSGSIGLYDYLSKHSSITVLPSYGNPLTQNLDMRGFGIENGHQNIVITINGRRLNNVDMAPQLLSNIPLSSIERIEIIKGSGAVAYGDGAMAGVINIITKETSGGEVNVASGSHGQSTASLSAGVTQEYFSVQVLAENSRSDGQRKADINGDSDETDTNNFAAHLKVFPAQGAEIRVGKERSWIDSIYGNPLTNQEFNKDPAQSGSYADWQGNIAPYNAQRMSTDVNLIGAGYRLNKKLSLNLDHTVEKKTSEFVGWGSDYDYRSTNISTEWIDSDLQVTLGVQLFDGERDSGTDKTSKDNQSVFIQTSYSLDNTLFLVGARHEKVKYTHEDLSNTALKDDDKLTAWELGINHQYSEQLSVFANLMSGYQAPDIDRFFDLFSGPTPTFNSFINPAKNKTLNVGFNHLTTNNKLKTTLFYSKLTDEIFLDPVTFANTNIDKSYKYGIEIQDQWQLTENFKANLNYSYTLAKIDSDDSSSGAFNGKRTPGVSPHTASLGLSYQVTNKGTLTLSETFRSKAHAINDFANNFSQKQRAYSTTDIGYQHKVDNITLYAQVNNLFDQRNGLWVADDAIYPVNFTRTWYAGIRASF